MESTIVYIPQLMNSTPGTEPHLFVKMPLNDEDVREHELGQDHKLASIELVHDRRTRELLLNYYDNKYDGPLLYNGARAIAPEWLDNECIATVRAAQDAQLTIDYQSQLLEMLPELVKGSDLNIDVPAMAY